MTTVSRIGREDVHITTSGDNGFDIKFSGGTPGPLVLDKISARLKCLNFKVQTQVNEGDDCWHCSQACPYPGGTGAILKVATRIVDEAFGVKSQDSEAA